MPYYQLVQIFLLFLVAIEGEIADQTSLHEIQLRQNEQANPFQGDEENRKVISILINELII
jgi:hypothetical protein